MTSLCDGSAISPANPLTPLTKFFRPSSLALIAIPLCAIGFLLWINQVRVRQINYVSSIGETVDAGLSSSSSRGAPQTRLIIPEHINTSYAWLNQTRQMLARNEWRVRRV